MILTDVVARERNDRSNLKKMMKRKLHIAIILTLSLVWLILSQAVGLAATTAQISQFGITWTFDKEYEYGQFANGDYWVVGPVTIIGIAPPSFVGDGVRTMETGTPDEWVPEVGRTVNGAMINPDPTTSDQGYDIKIPTVYRSALNKARPNGNDLNEINPLVVTPNASLISCISRKPNPIGYFNYPLKTAAILTVLDSPPPEGSFRPAYVGIDKTIKFIKDQLDYSLFGSLSPTANVPTLHKEVLNDPDAQGETVERMFERPWLDHLPGGQDNIHPVSNMPGYPREMSDEVGNAALMLNSNYTNSQKETLLIRMVQLGIDNYDVVSNGGLTNFDGHGGHGAGRKFPILLAGVVLDDSNMKNIGQKSGDYLYNNGYGAGNSPPDYIHFAEDDQTFYVKPDDVYEGPPYELHMSQDKFHTGTVSVDKDSTTVTCSDTIWYPKWSSSNYIVMPVPNNDMPKVYKIESFNGGTEANPSNTLTLTEPFEGWPDSVSNVNYQISHFLWYGHGNYGKFYDYEEYTNEHLGLPEWGTKHASGPIMDGLDWSAIYRRCCAANSRAGWVLAVHIMGIKGLWNHDALFDYQDRYMEIEKQLGNSGTWYRQWSRFPEDMWDTYRQNYGSVWTMSPTLTITATNGTVTKTPNKATYELGEIVTLEAIPDPGYEFVDWSGDLLDTGNPGKILMHANQFVTANFVAISNQPIADAGPDQTVIDENNDGEEQVTLDGSASKDPDGKIVSYLWSEGELQIATSVKPTVILSIGTHLITLNVTDNEGLTDTDTVTIIVLKEDKEFGKLPTGCYNNVFNPAKGEKALIIVNLPEQAHVKISLYDTRGNKIRELVDEEREAGTYPYYWYGKDDNGNVVGSGLYFVHIQAGNYKKTKKIVVVK